MNKTAGITLLELLIVIVIIGTLASIAVPRYNQVIERSRVREAISSLRLIRQGEIIYRADENTYWASSGAFDLDEIRDINRTLNLSLDVRNERNWDYSIISATQIDFTAAAQRRNSPYGSIEIDETGEIEWVNWTGPQVGE